MYTLLPLSIKAEVAKKIPPFHKYIPENVQDDVIIALPRIPLTRDEARIFLYLANVLGKADVEIDLTQRCVSPGRYNIGHLADVFIAPQGATVDVNGLKKVVTRLYTCIMYSYGDILLESETPTAIFRFLKQSMIDELSGRVLYDETNDVIYAGGMFLNPSRRFHNLRAASNAPSSI